jgi:hypothetical protein
VPTLWHAFLFLGLRFFPLSLFVFLLCSLTAFSCNFFLLDKGYPDLARRMQMYLAMFVL